MKVKIFNHTNNIITIENQINEFLEKNAIKEISGMCSAGLSNGLFIVLLYKEP